MTLLLRLLPYLALMALSAWGGWEFRDRAADAEQATTVAQHATAMAEAQAKARTAEHAKVREVARIDAEHEAALDEIRTTAGRLAADLRAGNVRLQKHWAGCETDNLSGDATAARLADEARQLQAESLERIAAITGEADAKERALQEYAREVSR